MIDGATTRLIAIGDLVFTVYEMGEGPLVLCLHGFPDTPRTFRLLLPALAAAGYRAVAPTMRGYEPSSQPVDGDYSMAALADDVAGFAQALDAAPAHLIGHDWGASIAYAAATQSPARWRSLTTLAVPHPAAFAGVMAGDYTQLRRSWYIFLFQLRGLAEGVVSANEFQFLQDLWRDWSPEWTPEAGDVETLQRAFAAPGVLDASLAYYRTALDAAAVRAAESAAIWANPIKSPTLGLTGEADGCISADIFEKAMPPALFSCGLSVVRVPGAGHFLHLERPALVHEHVMAFLRGATSGV